MSPGAVATLDHKLTKATSFFGVKLWIVIVICIAAFFVLILVFLCFYFLSWRRRRKPSSVPFTTLKPIGCKYNRASSLDKRLLSLNDSGIELSAWTPGKQAALSDRWGAQAAGTDVDLTDVESVARYPGRVRVVSDVKRGIQCYKLREIEAATNGFANKNLIGCGDFGVVYRGVLFDGTRVAAKKLLYDSGKAENFIAQVEAIGHAGHKTLVKLLGYCTEGACRILVYEYVDNGDLSQWLHGCIRRFSPLTWNIRMNIIQATAKGLAYLHEDIEPKVVHQHIKSSNILLDHQWNPKISDLGIAKVLGPEWTHIATSSMGMSGYIAPEYDYTGVFDEKTDVYSFGILVMELITGKTPVDYSNGTEDEVYIIDWLKSMVAEQNFDDVIDPKMPEVPPLKDLKRIVLIALRCVDPDVENRPMMGEVIHMFGPLDLLLSDESCVSA